RKVIMEEWRQKQTASNRAKAQFWKLAAPAVSDRFPIGQMDFIAQVDAAKLRQFYESTYCCESIHVVCVVDQSKEGGANPVNFDTFRQYMEEAFSVENCPRIGQPLHKPFPSLLKELNHGNQDLISYGCVADPDLVQSAVT